MNLKKYAISLQRFTEITKNFPKKKIAIIGDVGIDRYTIGEATRLNPEAPVPVVAVTSVVDKLGLAANVADNIIAFGARPALASLIGSDRNAEELIQLFEKKNIPIENIYYRSSRRTTLKERIIAMNQQVVRVDHERPIEISEEDESFFWQKLEPLIPEVDAVIIEDYSKGLMTKNLTNQIIASSKKYKKFVAVDPPSASHSRYLEYYKGASLVTPNLQEAEKLSGIEIRSSKDLIHVGNHLLEKLECSTLVITQGKDGLTFFTPNSSPQHVPTFAREVFDVSGAGDTVISMFTIALLSGASLEESALLANFAAGVEVGKPGTATVTIDELHAYMLHAQALL